jgi:hypothetical protein
MASSTRDFSPHCPCFFGPNDPLSLSDAQTPGDRREFSVEHIRDKRGESPVRSLGIAHRGDNDLRLFLSESLGICPGVEAN